MLEIVQHLLRDQISSKGSCIDVILGKSVDMSSVNIGNVYIVDIS